MIIAVIAMGMVEVSVMQVVDMVAVLDGNMAAIGLMAMSMIGMFGI